MLVSHKNSEFDLVVVGGGINGTAIAADAAGRGLKVLLCEKEDLASGTSSASSKLIHGGLRYLEQYAFKMVRHSLQERERLLNLAPHLVHPIRFILPLHQRMRSAWLIRAGLFLYDLLSGQTRLPRSEVVELENNIEINPLNLSLRHGYAFSDCTVNDARLVVLKALQAAEHQAEIVTHTKLVAAKHTPQEWILTLENQRTQTRQVITTRALVNAAGPWVDKIIQGHLHVRSQYELKLVKGSHIVLPKLYEGDQGYFLQNKDRRVIFVIPYHQQFTMVGTTDVPFHGSLENIHISEEEVEYLIDSVNQYFHHSVKSSQIISSWSGVRALVGSGSHTLSSVSREYKLELMHTPKMAPVLNVFGGKLTTHRYLAEEALSLLKPFFKEMGPSWTADAILPGGDLQVSFETFCLKLQQEFPFLPPELSSRYANYYGTRCYQFLKDKESLETMGEHFGHHLYEAEVEYLMMHEWAITVQDILERRTKLGLVFSEGQRHGLAEYLKKMNPHQ
ncbi:MAG: glycerol-3-phosphate dehydrogenase [Gammaproteobacteria bacterium]